MSDEHLTLAALQQWMQNSLILPRPDAGDQTERIVEASPRLTGAQRLAIYQRSYYLRILKCMREQFPALCHALGEKLFTDFAREYLRKYPSESYTLYELGSRFPRYLDETRPDRDETEENREIWADFMVDLARFERQLFVMFDAPGHEGKPFADADVPDYAVAARNCSSTACVRSMVAASGSRPK